MKKRYTKTRCYLVWKCVELEIILQDQPTIIKEKEELGKCNEIIKKMRMTQKTGGGNLYYNRTITGQTRISRVNPKRLQDKLNHNKSNKTK